MCENTNEEKSPIDDFSEFIMQEPWGSLSRTQINAAIFRLLVGENKIRLTDSDITIANQLSITPIKANNLRYQYDQFKTREDEGYFQQLLAREKIIISDVPKNSVAGENSENMIAVRIANKYCLTKMKQELPEDQVIPWTGLTANVIYVDSVGFLRYLYKTCDATNLGSDSIYLFTKRNIEHIKEDNHSSFEEHKKNMNQLKEKSSRFIDSKNNEDKEELRKEILDLASTEWPNILFKSITHITAFATITKPIFGS